MRLPEYSSKHKAFSLVLTVGNQGNRFATPLPKYKKLKR